MGVFMTASEANRNGYSGSSSSSVNRCGTQITTVDMESPAVKRGKSPMSETRQLWISNSLPWASTNVI